MNHKPIAFGTGQIPEGESCIQAILWALEAGYRHIDTAAIYDNESSVGEAIKRSGIPREELFVTSKLHYKQRGRATAQRELQASLGRLGLDYLDLYLIHWPANAHANPDDWKHLNACTWQGMEDNLAAGLTRDIGVSNFLNEHLDALLETAHTKPSVNQIEFHPGFWQQSLTEYNFDHHIHTQAWSPLGCGKLLQHPLIQQLAEKYNKSTAQICLRWCLQHGVTPIVKSVTQERISSNIQVSDFEITKEEMQSIGNMPTFAYSGMDPRYLL